MTIRVDQDRAAAIRRGIEPQAEGKLIVSVDLATLTEEQRGYLADHVRGDALEYGYSVTLVEGTQDELMAAIAEHQAAMATKDAERSAAEDAMIARIEAAIDGERIEEPCTIYAVMQESGEIIASRDDYWATHGGVKLETVQHSLPSYGDYVSGPRSAEYGDRYRDVVAAVHASDEAAWLALARDHAAEAEIERDKITAAKEAEERERAEAHARTLSDRLELGEVTLSWSMYNERRYGCPWGAVVTLADGRLEYDFRAAIIDGGHGNATTVTIPCRPGDIIAWGQKDIRKPSASDAYLKQMRDDGELVEISRAEATRCLKSR